MQRYAVIVDPLSTGREYPAAFREAGVEPIAVMTAPEPAPAFIASWHPENFEHILYYEGDIKALAEKVKAFDPICVVPGSETATEVCDALVEEVLPGTLNDPARTLARRDKWEMAVALQKAGVPHLRQINTADEAEVAAWLKESGLEGKKLVVKPPKSMGADNVHVVEAGADWRHAFGEVVGQENKAGFINESAIVQEFAEGVEYLIDSYSVDGNHAFVDICRYVKVQRGDRIGIYDQVNFVEHDDADAQLVWKYVLEVLEAVGIRNGCGHTEVILTEEGPRLLEIAARPAGGGHQIITTVATGTNQILRTVAHRVRGEQLPDFRLIQQVRGTFVSADAHGVWKNAELFDGLKNGEVPAYFEDGIAYKTGDVVPLTVDLFTPIGWIILAAPTMADIERDYKWIKDKESQIIIEPVA
ncbi:ATP-grasp domain-containing protein [Longispora albida]|uniref:ATP-grasp domain-containing protein n=1 Tax=Longispora albida TaxID=203523 RepID=UPI000363B653|nr:ATP-grasp domain-containing protein [Longispora albida]